MIYHPTLRALSALWRRHPSDEDVAIVRQLTEPEWTRVAQFALQTFTGQLVHARSLETGLLEGAPEAVRVRLERVHAWNLARNVFAGRQIRVLGDALQDAGVQALVFKGAHLCRVYETRGARAMADLDVLVPRGDLFRSQEVLLHLGYGPPGRRPEPLADLHHLEPFTHERGLPVELHGSLGSTAEATPWQRMIWEARVPFGDEPYAVMNDEDALVYAARHLADHHFFFTTNAIAGLTDIDLLLEKADVDEAMRRAEAWGIAPGLRLSIALSDLLVGSGRPPPPELEDLLQVAMWMIWDAATLGLGRFKRLPGRPTLNPPPPIRAAGRGGRRHYLKNALFPDWQDLALEHRFGVKAVAYPVHWARSLYRHLPMLRMLDPAHRRMEHERWEAKKRFLVDYLRSER